MRVLLGFALAALVLSSAFAAAVLTGVISIGPQRVVEAPSAETPQQAALQAPTANEPSSASAAPSAAPQPPQPQARVVKQETYGDWIYTCNEHPQTKEVRCSITQTLSEANTKRLVFLWRIVQNGNGGLVGIWQTPNAVLLHGGIGLDVGTPEPIVVPYETCARGRCQAVVNLSQEFIDALARTEKAVATIVATNGQKVNLNLGVNGLADGLAALRAPSPPAAVANPSAN